MLKTNIGNLALAFFLTSSFAANAGKCSASQESLLLEAQAEIATLAAKAVKSVPSSNGKVDKRYTEWFGAYSKVRAERVSLTLNQVIAVTNVGQIVYECEPNTGNLCSNPKTWAWVNERDEYNVHICEAFFKGSKDERGPLLLHELTHFDSVGDTVDPCGTLKACRDLAKNDPDKAVLSASSFQIFVFQH